MPGPGQQGGKIIDVDENEPEENITFTSWRQGRLALQVKMFMLYSNIGS